MYFAESHTHVHTNASIYPHINAHTHTHTNPHTQMHTNNNVHAHSHTHTHTLTHSLTHTHAHTVGEHSLNSHQSWSSRSTGRLRGSQATGSGQGQPTQRMCTTTLQVCQPYPTGECKIHDLQAYYGTFGSYIYMYYVRISILVIVFVVLSFV